MPAVASFLRYRHEGANVLIQQQKKRISTLKYSFNKYLSPYAYNNIIVYYQLPGFPHCMYFPISINLFFSFSLSHINTEYMVPLLSGIVYHVAVVQLLVLISVGSWWYFLPATRAEGGTGWMLLPVLAHPTCTHWPQPLSTAVRGSVKGELVKLPSIWSACLFNNSNCTCVCLRSKIAAWCWQVVSWVQFICNLFHLNGVI